MSIYCEWDPAKHDGKPCPHHHISMRGGDYYFGNTKISEEEFNELRKTHTDNFDSEGDDESLSHLPRLPKKPTIQETMRDTNPNRQQHIELDVGRQNNCQKCCAVFELRMRGYDVTAAPFNPCFHLVDGKLELKSGPKENKIGVAELFGRGWENRTSLGIRYGRFNWVEFEKDYNSKVGKTENFSFCQKDCWEMLNKAPTTVIKENISNFPNSRWVVSVPWHSVRYNGKLYHQGSHVFMAIVDKDGKVNFVDGQNNQKKTYANTWSRIKYGEYDTTSCYRIDNKEIEYPEALEYYLNNQGGNKDGD